MRFIARLIFLLTFAFVSSFFFVKPTFAANYQLQGSVKDNSAVVISGATVNVFTPGTTTDVVSPTTTDSLGNYAFSSVPQGTYDIKVTPSGSGFSSAIALSQNISTNTILNFILVPAGTDYVRYQIKNPSGVVVYDTQPGAADTADPTTVVTKGKVDIH